MMAASVNIIELPSKQVHSITLPNEEGGDMISMERFMSAVREKLSKELSLMVGDRRIRMKSDKARPVRYFLLDGFPWYAHVHTRQVFLNDVCGSTYAIPYAKCTTVLDLMIRIEELQGTQVENLMLIYGGRYLRPSEKSLSEIIPDNSRISQVMRLPGGGPPRPIVGIPFVDVADKSGPERMQWNESAPVWRVAEKGLCLEGKCTNKRCKAYGSMVIMNQGFTDFDLISEAHTCKCPLCCKSVVPITCAFNNCKWKVLGRKIAKFGQPPEMFKTAWKLAGDAYDRFSPDENGTANFLDLKILCKEAEAAPICVACTFSMDSGNLKKAQCGHAFHTTCFDLATRDGNCIECFANNTMTNYQKRFS